MSVRKEVSPLSVPCSSGNVTEQFLVADWDPLHAMEHSLRFSSANGLSSYDGGSSNSAAIERMPSLSCFGSESLSEIMNSFTLPDSGQMATALCSQDFPSTNHLVTEKNVEGKKRKKLPESGALQSHFPLNVEAEQQKDVPIETVKNTMEKDEKKQKNEVNTGVKDNGDSSKEDYIHIRAKRGQATNSHSLAERVRREKISERMRLLQDIVPGCNKITGKAVMLDEIINYVQSLQKQVEFLSMKLATVIPETNLDIEHIFTKENLHSLRYGSSSAYGYGPEIGTSHSHLQVEIGIPSVSNSMDMLRTSMPQISGSWDHEFQNAFQMGLIPNLHVNEPEMNGSMKLEL